MVGDEGGRVERDHDDAAASPRAALVWDGSPPPAGAGVSAPGMGRGESLAKWLKPCKGS